MSYPSRWRRGATAAGLWLGLWAASPVWAGGAAPAARDEADPTVLARAILDDDSPAADREAVIKDHPALSDRLLRALTADLKPGTKEEYRRIPWIWRVAIAAGKRNDAAELARVLDVALPAADAPLDDWRAVVIGGGLINGITLSGGWPAERLERVVKDAPGLAPRWSRALRQAEAMADDESVPTGTRYDALRLVGVEPWERGGARLTRYLAKGVHPELQQGAVSAAGDVRAPEAAQALLAGLDHYSKGNRDFALDALLRDDARALALLDAVAAGRVRRDDLGPKRVEALRTFPAEPVRARAAAVLGR